jgi:hypothetical protein
VEKFDSIEIVTPYKLAKEIAISESKLKANLDQQVKEIAHTKAVSVEAQIADLKSTLLQSVKVIQTRIGQEHGKISRLESVMETMRVEASHQSNSLRSTTKLEEKIKSLEEKLADSSRFKKLEDKMNALYAKADELAIRFAGLGFRGQAEANAWLSMHIPSHDFGWILDPHIVMEHIHYAVTAEDTLKRLEGIYKLSSLPSRKV